LLELTVNAAYMLDDPETRAVKFEASDSISRKRAFESIQSFGLGSRELRERVARTARRGRSCSGCWAEMEPRRWTAT
jgi:hypothetical protein